MGDAEPAPAVGERTVTVFAANAAVAKPKSAPQKIERVRLRVDFRVRERRRRRSSENRLAKGCTNSSWECRHGLCRGATDAPGAARPRRHCPPDEGIRGSTILIRLKIASNRWRPQSDRCCMKSLEKQRSTDCSLELWP